MKTVINCDWGTSALRLWLVDTTTTTVLAEARSTDGILQTFQSWKDGGKDDRERYYLSVLQNQIKKLEEQYQSSLDNVPLVISGMVSSGIGLVELPYKEMPFDSNKDNLNVKMLEASDEFKHSILVVSGMRSSDDAMRGEETLLIGCLQENNRKEQLYIFPGTHSKHVVVKENVVVDLKTYMTGELFDLLAAKSILASSVKKSEGLNEELQKNFEAGLKASGESGLLHNAFRVRINDLFKKLDQQKNYYFLSGVVIGAELNDLPGGIDGLTLVASGELRELYSIALKYKSKDCIQINYQSPEQALIKGQQKIFERQGR